MLHVVITRVTGAKTGKLAAVERFEILEGLRQAAGAALAEQIDVNVADFGSHRTLEIPVSVFFGFGVGNRISRAPLPSALAANTSAFISLA